MSTADEPVPSNAVDGRRARPERGRRAVVDAMLELLDEGVVDPGAQPIAERAGVSVRSVFRYFEDLDALAAAAVQRQIERVGHLYEAPPASGSRRQRVDALVAQRRRLYEAIAPVRRHAMHRGYTQPSIRHGLEQAATLLRAQVAAQFAPELDGRSGAEQRELLDALEAACSWSAWDHLRTDLDRPPARAAAVVSRTVLGLLLT